MNVLKTVIFIIFARFIGRHTIWELKNEILPF